MGILSSYRWRRRLAWISLATAVAAVAAAVALVIPNKTPFQPKAGSGPAPTYVPPKQIRVTPAMRKQFDAMLTLFVHSALPRRNLASSYPLVTASMRGGMSLAKWKQGDIPVMPYEPSRFGWRVSYAYADDIGLDLLTQPGKGETLGPIAFAVDLKPVGRGRARRWLIESFYPQKIFPGNTPASAKPKLPTKTRGRKVAAPPPQAGPGPTKAPLGGLYIAIPFAILGLIVLVPLLLFTVSWYRNRRAERAYRAETAARALADERDVRAEEPEDRAASHR